MSWPVCRGPNLEGCDHCANFEFGCCMDELTPAEGPNFEVIISKGSDFQYLKIKLRKFYHILKHEPELHVSYFSTLFNIRFQIFN